MSAPEAGGPAAHLAPISAPQFARPRDVLLHPVNLAPLAVYPLYLLGRHFGYVNDYPMWVLVGTLLVAHLSSTTLALVFPPGTARGKPRLHLAIEMLLIGVNIYVLGWGALLAVGFVFSASGHMAADGARLGKYAIGFAALTIAAGETAIALGWVHTLIPEPRGHGLAAMEGVGVCLIIWLLSYTQAEKARAEQSVQRFENRLEALVRHASDAILVLDAEHRVTYASPSIERMLGATLPLHERFEDGFVHPEHMTASAGLLADVLRRPGAVAWIELPLRHADGDYRWFEAGLTNLLDDPAVEGLVCNIRDVTERREAQELLTFQAHHDALTRLPNRWFFLERLDAAQHAARATKCWNAVLMLDVDQFKLVNDSL
ncbi:MAG TPA: PAS domain S-box protein, partial [Acidimicrobiia bacterium]|nr:PAS domain S-box protein [Acidimicrobiia bacterium]